MIDAGTVKEIPWSIQGYVTGASRAIHRPQGRGTGEEVVAAADCA